VDTLTRLNKLVGKQGLVKIQLEELAVTSLAADPPVDVRPQTKIEDAISRSQFTVRLDTAYFPDGRHTAMVFGAHISKINGPY
jgi:hypothetical protein